MPNNNQQLCNNEQWHAKLFSGGWVIATNTVDVIEPATGDTITTVGCATPDEISAASLLAHNAQAPWYATPYEERANILRKAAMLVEQHTDEISDWIIRESGSIAGKAAFEIQVTIKALLEAAAMPSQAQGLILPTASEDLSLARRIPHGVVGVISPFNFPLYLSMRAVAPALAVGNSVVVKPDPRTPISGGFIIARIFEQAGLPNNVLHVLPGGGDAGARLCETPHVAMIQFTGSSESGRKVGETASRHLKKVSLELGGKNALIVLDDADADIAASNIAWASYLHSGQICMTAGKILLQRNIADAVISRLVNKAKNMPVGNPASEQVMLGPMINTEQLLRTHAIVMRSIEQGATLKAGGNYENLFYQPTVLSDVKPHMAAFKEEIFGPVASITVFDSDEEAIALANQTEYGLSAGVIGSVGRAMAIGNQLRAAAVHINNQTVSDEVVNPFGGVGASGNGSSIGGPANWEEFTNWQWLSITGKAKPYPF
ncbi:MAG: benzaldehyde dehydrogenase [Spongiibacteraceae bacterium]|nr:benzaldehyde dehydrogenase [Spongiibacteraceae bacterium]